MMYKKYFWALSLCAALLGINGCKERPSLPQKQQPILRKPIQTDIAIDIHNPGNKRFDGGIASEGLDLGMIRLGKHGNTERLVFDSYKQDNKSETPSVHATHSGKYHFIYAPQKKLIVATINGYKGFSALSGNKIRRFDKSDTIDSVRLLKTPHKNSYKFVIILKRPADINVFDLTHPARIVVDITPRTSVE